VRGRERKRNDRREKGRGERERERANFIFRQNKNGETPLHKAVFNGRVRFLLAEMLIRHHANLNMVSTKGVFI
jgi:ankyrin repeat protein